MYFQKLRLILSKMLFKPVCVLLILVAYTKAEDERIVGGTDAEEGEFAYQVSLRRTGKHFCGGSIIKNQWILTAAHCVEGQKSKDITVVAGTNSLDSGGTEYKVEKLIPHESYSTTTVANDIALIKLQDEITYEQKIKQVELPFEDVPENTKLTLSGWGTTSYPGKVPNKLQTINLVSVSNEKCAKEHTFHKILATHICTFTKSGEGACHGDSGGPLVYKGKQVGVVSWGLPCAKGKPDVFTRVYSYKDWISSHLNTY